ncbi:MAG: TonB-dependent receptor [Bacteroidales bacterium]|nr:TonB-dependent receptor [Bacteroidales bacterium]
MISAGVSTGSGSEITGAVTNPYGFYTLTLPQGKRTLTYSYMGYSEQSITLDLQRDTTINISLNPDLQLNSATVVATKDAGILSTKMSAIEVPVTVIQQMPTLFGEADVLKTIQLMPGVQAGTEGLSGIYVRGGGPEENLLLLDGISLYNAEHLLGIFSIFQPEAVKKVTLYKGSFPARYGGRISSIIDIRTNDGNMKEYHGTVSIGALSDKFHLEGPIIKDKLAFSISGRAMHTFFFTPILKSYDVNGNYYFYDLNGKLSWRISDKDRIYLNAYNGRDIFFYEDSYSGEGTRYDGENEKSYRETDSNDIDIRWGNTLAALRWNHVFNSRLFSNATVAYTRYKMSIGAKMKEVAVSEGMMDETIYSINYHSGMRDFTAKLDFDFTPSPSHLIKFGAEYVNHTFIPETMGGLLFESEAANVKVDTTFEASANATLHGHEISVYAEDDISVGERLTLNPGLHAAFFYTLGTPYWSLEPRMSAKFNFTEDWAAKASYSRMAQYVHLLSPAKISLPIDLWVPITDKIKPVTSDQVSIGAYYSGIPGWEFSLEGYYKWMHNILEYSDGTSFFGNSSNWQNNVEMGEGLARGVELFVEKKDGPTTGWLGYTLAWSDRVFPNGVINGGEPFPYRYDRRHNVSLVVNHKFSRKLSISGTWTFASGGTMTIPERQTVVVYPNGSTDAQDYSPSRNNYRMPSSHRLNLSLNYTKQKRRGQALWSFGVYNAYNNMNPNFIFVEDSTQYNPDPQEGDISYRKKIKLTKITILPIIPSITYTYKF